MDRSWLLYLPPAGLSAWARLTRVGRLRHEGARLWMDLQSGTVTLHLDQPITLSLTKEADGDRVWLGAQLQQGDVRLSLQARVDPGDVPPDAREGSCDGPRVRRSCLWAVLDLIRPADSACQP